MENFQLKSCEVQLKTLHSKPGPFSLKKFTNEVQIKTPAVTAAPTTAGAAVSARETRESISIEVVDEFVTDEISPCKTPDELTVEKPKVEAVDTDGDESSVEEEVEIVTTKSGRKIMKPKMQHFITTFKGSKIPGELRGYTYLMSHILTVYPEVIIHLPPEIVMSFVQNP